MAVIYTGPFVFEVGDRVSAKYEKSYYKWPGEIFDVKRSEDGTVHYTVMFDDGDIDTSVKEHFIKKSLTVSVPPRQVSIMAPLFERKVSRTFPWPRK